MKKIRELINRFKTVAGGRLHRFVMWFEYRRRGKTIENIKAHMLFFGYDISDMTDEEIEEGLVKISEIVSKTGVTTKQAADALSQLSCGLQFVDNLKEDLC